MAFRISRNVMFTYKVIFSGTGVGLVNKAQPAGAIVREVREGAKERVRQVASRF